MGIYCEINLNKPPNGAYYSGENVSGTIKYVLNEPMEMEKITVSLKGIGLLRVTQTTNNDTRTYVRSEAYVDFDAVVQERKQTIQQGSHELKLNFQLPPNLPPSFKFVKAVQGYHVFCKIKYYVRIRFDRPGKLSFAKHFRKNITVLSTITPRLPTEPVTHGERSKLIQLFSTKPKTIIMKANILNSVIANGGKIEIQSKIENNTNLDLKCVEIKLLKCYKFKLQRTLKRYEDVPNCDSKTGSIKSGTTQTMPIEFVVPSDYISLDYSNIVSIDYKVRITAVVPMPHKNVVLDVPVQIGDIVHRNEVYDPPPTYWEAMGESNEKDDDASDDDTDGDKKGGKWFSKA